MTDDSQPEKQNDDQHHHTIMDPPTNEELPGLKVTIKILQARNLVSKDYNVIGRSTKTSDPYIRVAIGGKALGKTITRPKTLDPIFNQSFEYTLTEEDAKMIMSEEEELFLELEIWDEDRHTRDDPMGFLQIPINFQTATPVWYQVGKGDENHQICKDATGEVEVRILRLG